MLGTGDQVGRSVTSEMFVVHAPPCTRLLPGGHGCSGWLENKDITGSGRCGSVDGAPACKPKGHRFDSHSGHMPGLWARSPVGGAQEATIH